LAYSVRLENVSKDFNFVPDRLYDFKIALNNWVRGKVTPQRQVKVLKNISFEIEEGEFVGIMGRNGVGKSTLLKLISKIYLPSEGKITVIGTIAPLLALGAGFQPLLSGYENVFLNAAILGFGRKHTSHSIKSIIDFTELGEAIHRPVKHYSSGMLMRLGFSIASHLGAQILLFDEVLGVGDAAFQVKCRKRIVELNKEGRTVILVTHSPDEIKAHCDRCIVLEKTKILFDGTGKNGADVYSRNLEVNPNPLELGPSSHLEINC